MHAAKWMVVDDHEPVRTMLCSWLQAEFEAIQFLDAASGEEALLDGIPVRVIGRDMLIKNKLAAGRPKDLADVYTLQKTRPL